LVFCPGDDLILKFSTQVAEVVAVASHSHDQIPVLFGMLLRSA
jgi:hypothetical protein